eukprot:TRINITY_DN222_c0_g2_i6.p3 TRINITY_DN222_c0_g2~~TRINITY_DN222_c0_g2_i6.p3  ORF type:complete len:139 (-),score=1.65 TRINITY_DN222_c0_g2_i6:99-515(-)
MQKQYFMHKKSLMTLHSNNNYVIKSVTMQKQYVKRKNNSHNNIWVKKSKSQTDNYPANIFPIINNNTNLIKIKLTKKQIPTKTITQKLPPKYLKQYIKIILLHKFYAKQKYKHNMQKQQQQQQQQLSQQQQQQTISSQ